MRFGSRIYVLLYWMEKGVHLSVEVVLLSLALQGSLGGLSLQGVKPPKFRLQLQRFFSSCTLCGNCLCKGCCGKDVPLAALRQGVCNASNAPMNRLSFPKLEPNVFHLLLQEANRPHVVEDHGIGQHGLLALELEDFGLFPGLGPSHRGGPHPRLVSMAEQVGEGQPQVVEPPEHALCPSPCRPCLP